MPKLLNLGAGNRIIAGAVNNDWIAHRPEIDAVWDLNELPWPWEDGSFDRIEAIAVLEHLTINLIESIDECWRVLRPMGQLRIKLPAWDHERSWDDVTHVHKVGAGALDQFDPRTERGRNYAFYTRRKWAIKKRTRGTTAYYWAMIKMPLDWNGKED